MLCHGFNIHSNAWGIVKIATVMAMYEVRKRTHSYSGCGEPLCHRFIRIGSEGLSGHHYFLEEKNLDSERDALVISPHKRQCWIDPDEF